MARRNRLRLTWRPDGSWSLKGFGAAAVPALGIITEAIALIGWPDSAAFVAFILGLAEAFGIVWLIFLLVTGRVVVADLLDNAVIQAFRTRSGAYVVEGLAAMAWPLSAVLGVVLLAVLAPNRIWIFWTTGISGLVVFAGVFWYLHSSKSPS